MSNGDICVECGVEIWDSAASSVKLCKVCMGKTKSAVVQLETCVWSNDDGGEDWATSCRNIFRLEESLPSECHMWFCCFCGKPLVEHAYVEVPK